MPRSNEALSAALERWNGGDLDGYLDLYDERIKLHGYSPEPMNKAEVRAFYEGVFHAFDTPKLDFHEILWSEDACAIRYTMVGRHAGEFMGVPATGSEVALPGITIMHFDGERVIERFSQADLLGFLVQVGAIPAPA